MDANTLNQEIKTGNVKFIQPPQPQTEVLPPDDSMNQFFPLLTALRQPRQSLAAAPTFTPTTFPDQIQFEDDGTTKSLWLYINNVWQQFQPTGGSLFSGNVVSGAAGPLFPSGWSISHPSPGHYTITHNLGTTSYVVALTTMDSNGLVTAAAKNSNSLQVLTMSGGLNYDVDFDFILTK